MAEKKFWCVWKKNGGAPPSKRHDSLESAINEATRLCQQSMEPYFVLETIGVVTPSIVPANYTNIND